MTQSLLENVKQKIDRLIWDERLELIAYIIRKGQRNSTFSAEETAIQRLGDLDDPSQWITTIQAGEEINKQELKEWLK
ncbi:MAG: hypothetical protein ACRCU2_19320 [Planktothrix sp.]